MNTPLVIGHACAGGEAPANTLAGVRACLAARAEAMEIDVQLSADNVPVLMHDTTLDRTTDLSGPVRAFTAAELAKADAGDGESVPTLREVLDLVDGRLTVMCELKSTNGDRDLDHRLVVEVLNVLYDREAESWAAIHSFSPRVAGDARDLDVLVPAALISGPVWAAKRDGLFEEALRNNAQAVSVNFECIDRDFIIAAKRRQLTAWTWTPDDEADWRHLIDAGVDGIITNHPNRLRAMLGG